MSETKKISERSVYDCFDEDVKRRHEFFQTQDFAEILRDPQNPDRLEDLRAVIAGYGVVNLTLIREQLPTVLKDSALLQDKVCRVVDEALQRSLASAQPCAV